MFMMLSGVPPDSIDFVEKDNRNTLIYNALLILRCAK